MDEDVDAAVLGDDPVQHFGGLLLVGDVELGEAGDVLPVERCEVGPDDDVPARLQRVDDGRADAAAGAGDQGDLGLRRYCTALLDHVRPSCSSVGRPAAARILSSSCWVLTASHPEVSGCCRS